MKAQKHPTKFVGPYTKKFWRDFANGVGPMAERLAGKSLEDLTRDIEAHRLAEQKNQDDARAYMGTELDRHYAERGTE